MENRKAAIANMAKLDPKIAGQVKSVHEHPDMVAACAKRDKLKADLAAIEKKVISFYEGPQAASSIPSAEKDAQALLDGTSIAELAGQSRDTEKQILIRQRDALIKAIEIQQSEIQQLNVKLITEGCKELEPVAKKYIQVTIDAFEQVGKSLKNLEVFFQFLSHKGYPQGLRPAHFQTNLFELNVLYGGPCNLDYYIEQRKAVWKIADKK